MINSYRETITFLDFLIDYIQLCLETNTFHSIIMNSNLAKCLEEILKQEIS